jgi:hypothetical protein
LNQKNTHVFFQFLGKNILFIVAPIFLLYFNTSLYSQHKSIVLSDIDLDKKLDFIPYTKIYETENTYKVWQIDSLIKNHKLPVSKQIASHGFSQKYYWLHFSIQWKDNDTIPLALELNNPFIDNLLLYKKINNRFYKIGYGGDRNQKFDDRNYKNRRFILPLNNNRKPTDYYLMIDKRNASVSFPLVLWNKNYFEITETKQNIYYGLFFGILFFISLLVTSAGLLMRNKLFLYYGAYAFFMALYLFTSLGFSFQYLYPKSLNLNNYSRVILIVLLANFSALFLIHFFNLKKHSPKITKTFKVINLVLITITVAWVFLVDLYQLYTVWLLKTMYILLLFIFILAFFAAFKALKTNKTNAIIFFIAFSFIILGVLTYLAIEYGIIEETFFIIHPILLGSALEVVILSGAMLHQFIKIIKHKLLLEKENSLLETKNLQLKDTTLQLKNQLNKNTPLNKTIILRSKVVLNTEDVMYITSDGPYLDFYLFNKINPEVDRNTFKWALSALPSNTFIQIHRSCIVNIKYVKILKASEIILNNDTSLKISRTFKNNIKALKT